MKRNRQKLITCENTIMPEGQLLNTMDFYYRFILISIIAHWQASSNLVMRQTYTEEAMI